jgi:hypothetical protein
MADSIRVFTMKTTFYLAWVTVCTVPFLLFFNEKRELKLAGWMQ